MEVAMPSRKPRKAVRSTDPGQSALWLLPPACGTVVGATIPYLSTLGPKWAAACMALNAIGGLAATTPQFRERISARFHNQQISDTAGVLKNGISNKHMSNDDLYSLRVHRSNRKDITDFVRRDIQNQLTEHLHNGKPILIEGPSMSGKTRLAIETIRSHWPDSPLWFPRDDGDIEKLLKNDQPPAPGAIVLLDDVDRFLSNQSLTLGQLNQWISNSCIIMATMMHSQYIKYCDRTNEKVTGWDVINRLERLTLNPSLSATELNAVQFTSYADQLKQIKNIGLGPLLGCAEAVRTAFADELEKHSWCGALIQAATDWRRIGLGPATKEQIETLATSYKAGKRSKHDRNKAWQQATSKIRHTVSILQQTESNRWEILDIIADNADWKISEHTFTALQNITLSAQQTRQTAITMVLQGASPSSTNAMFQRAIAADPHHATTLGAYALFLKNIRGDMEEAEQMYQRAIAADPHHATHLGNYAIFLEDIRGDMDQAQDMYQRAIAADPHHANILGNYAHFLKYIRGDTDGAQDMMNKAQDMYQQAIAANPTNATTLGAYAFFLENVSGDMVQAEQMYQRAIAADPINATTLGAYALFLQRERGDMDQAEQMYQRAIDIGSHHADDLGNYALFLHTVRHDPDQAEQMYQRAIAADPRNAISLGNYAQILFAKSDDTKAISLTEKAISLAGDDEKSLQTECHFYLFAHSPNHRKDSGRALKALLADGVTTGDWSFQMNLERLRSEEDPRLDLLEAVAQTLGDGDMSRLNAFEEWRDL